MRLVLDTHAVIWAVQEQRSLSGEVREALEDPDNEVLVSPVSAYEALWKFRNGKLDIVEPLLRDFRAVMREMSFVLLDISFEDTVVASLLPSAHRDPFDRILAAQAIVAGAVLVTIDRQLAAISRHDIVVGPATLVT